MTSGFPGMPDMPDVLEVDVRIPGIAVDPAGSPTIELDPEPGGPTVVAVVSAGPAGERGPAGGFTHTQTTPAATWIIDHQLGRYPASVLVVVDGEQVDTDVAFPDIGTISIVFATPQSGRAEIV